MAEQIHIGFGIDKNFGRFAGITITSLVHNNIQHDLNIHIVYDELLPEDMDRLKKTEQLYRNLTLHFYQITSTEGMTFIVPPGHITQAMYYRYLFADLLPKSVKRLIYLDADIICKDDILPLWQTDLHGRVLGAVRDWGEDRSCGRIGLKNGRYFNSGVLGFNIKKCREFALTDKLLKRLAEVKNPMIVDQDIFNSVCEGRVFYYSPDWNVEWHTYYLYGNLLPYQLPRDFYEKYLKVIKNPSILHYAVDMKPWDCPEHSTAEIFWHYAQKTPFFARIIYKHFEQKIYALSRQKPEKAAVRAAEVQKIPLKDKLKYYRYKFLSFAAFGSKKSYYGEKKRKMKQKIKSIRSRELSAC